MSIFSLVKGGKEHEVFEMRMLGGEVLNSYQKNEMKLNNKGQLHIKSLLMMKMGMKLI